jgi:hypothetical protein
MLRNVADANIPVSYPVGSTVFNNTHASLVIYVPAAAINSYRLNWAGYVDKIQAGSPPPAP